MINKTTINEQKTSFNPRMAMDFFISRIGHGGGGYLDAQLTTPHKILKTNIYWLKQSPMIPPKV